MGGECQANGVRGGDFESWGREWDFFNIIVDLPYKNHVFRDIIIRNKNDVYIIKLEKVIKNLMKLTIGLLNYFDIPLNDILR